MVNSHIHLSSFTDRRTILPTAMAVGEIIQGVYCGFDTRNGEPLYVGLSENIRSRIYQHIQQLNRRSKTKLHWDEDFKADHSIIEWKLLEVIDDRHILNEREEYWWSYLEEPRLNVNRISKKAFRTGGDTRKRHPGMEVLLRMRAERMTVLEIASELGVSKNSVYGWFSDAQQPFTDSAQKRTEEGLPKRTEDFLAQKVNLEKLKAEVASGDSFLAISNRYGLERRKMQEILEENGAFGKRTRAYKDQLAQRFPKDAIADLLSRVNLYAQELSNELEISSDEVGVLVDHYSLKGLLGPPWARS